MESKNFISVSGVTTLEQLNSIRGSCRKNNIDLPIVIGYQVSHKSIHQGVANFRQPLFSKLAELHARTYECGFRSAIHYHSKNNEEIIPDLERVVDSLGIATRPVLAQPLVQFNTLPPSLEVLAKTKEMGFATIFKVAVADTQNAEGGSSVWKGAGIQDAVQGDVALLVRQVRERAAGIDYAMFDPSHGTGHGIDTQENSLALRFGRKLQEDPRLDHIGIVYAGGIGPSNVGEATRCLSKGIRRGCSIDAESQLRMIVKEGNTIVQDDLDIVRVRQYLLNAKLYFTP